MAGGRESEVRSQAEPSARPAKKADVAPAAGQSLLPTFAGDGGQPLTGIRVIDLGHFIAGAQTAALLGQFGADVLRIEPPVGGNPAGTANPPGSAEDDTLAWLSGGRGPRQVSIDLRQAGGGALFRKLVAKADVLIDNLRPGALAACGFDGDRLHKLNPGLVLLRISTPGQSGPQRRRPGVSPVAHASGGLACLAAFLPLETTTVLPASATEPLGDYLSGVTGAISVMVALRHRQQTGRGQVIESTGDGLPLDTLDDPATSRVPMSLVGETERGGTIIPFPRGPSRPLGDT